MPTKPKRAEQCVGRPAAGREAERGSRNGEARGRPRAPPASGAKRRAQRGEAERSQSDPANPSAPAILGRNGIGISWQGNRMRGARRGGPPGKRLQAGRAGEAGTGGVRARRRRAGRARAVGTGRGVRRAARRARHRRVSGGAAGSRGREARARGRLRDLRRPRRAPAHARPAARSRSRWCSRRCSRTLPYRAQWRFDPKADRHVLARLEVGDATAAAAPAALTPEKTKRRRSPTRVRSRLREMREKSGSEEQKAELAARREERARSEADLLEQLRSSNPDMRIEAVAGLDPEGDALGRAHGPAEERPRRARAREGGGAGAARPTASWRARV